VYTEQERMKFEAIIGEGKEDEPNTILLVMIENTKELGTKSKLFYNFCEYKVN